MGTGYNGDGNCGGIIPQVMDTICRKVDASKDGSEFLIRVSFIEVRIASGTYLCLICTSNSNIVIIVVCCYGLQIFKEEVFDLLDANHASFRLDTNSGAKPSAPARVPIQIRETATGGITLAGVTEAEVKSKEEMASYLTCGSSSRATASTNMNTQSRYAVHTPSLRRLLVQNSFLFCLLRIYLLLCTLIKFFFTGAYL